MNFYELPTEAKNIPINPVNSGLAMTRKLSSSGGFSTMRDIALTTPAVYQAALIISGPLIRIMGAIKEPSKPV